MKTKYLQFINEELRILTGPTDEETLDEIKKTTSDYTLKRLLNGYSSIYELEKLFNNEEEFNKFAIKNIRTLTSEYDNSEMFEVIKKIKEKHPDWKLDVSNLSLDENNEDDQKFICDLIILFDFVPDDINYLSIFYNNRKDKFDEYVKKTKEEDPDWEINISDLDYDESFDRVDFQKFLVYIMQITENVPNNTTLKYLYYKHTQKGILTENTKKSYDELMKSLKLNFDGKTYTMDFNDFSDLSEYFENDLNLDELYNYSSYNSSDFNWNDIYDIIVIDFIIPLAHYLYDLGFTDISIDTINKYDNKDYYNLSEKERLQLQKNDQELSQLYYDVKLILRKENDDEDDKLQELYDENDSIIEEITDYIAQNYRNSQEQADVVEYYDRAVNALVDYFCFTKFEDDKYCRYTKLVNKKNEEVYKLQFEVGNLDLLEELIRDNSLDDIISNYDIDFTFENLMDYKKGCSKKISVDGDYLYGDSHEYINDNIMDHDIDCIDSKYFEVVYSKNKVEEKLIRNFKDFKI